MADHRSDALFEAICLLLPTERLRLVERVIHDLIGTGSASVRPSAVSVLGLFAGEPELLDEVVEAAMLARERDAMRARQRSRSTRARRF